MFFCIKDAGFVVISSSFLLFLFSFQQSHADSFGACLVCFYFPLGKDFLYQSSWQLVVPYVQRASVDFKSNASAILPTKRVRKAGPLVECILCFSISCLPFIWEA